MRISHKLVLGCLILAAMLWAVGSYSVGVSRTVLRSVIEESSATLATKLMDEVDRGVHGCLSDWRVFTVDPSAQRTIAESNRRFAAMPDAHSYIQQCDAEWLATPDSVLSPLMKDTIYNDLSLRLRKQIAASQGDHGGLLYGEAFITNRFGANIAQSGRTSDYRQDDEEWWQRARAEGYYVGQLNFDESAAANSVDVCVRIDNEYGHFIGVLKAVLGIESVTAPLQSLSLQADDQHGESGHGVEVVLLAADGTVVFSSYGAETGTDVGSAYGDVLANSPRESNLTYQRTDESRGAILASCAYSRGFDEYRGLGWTLIVEHSADEIFGPVKSLQSHVLYFAAAVTVVGLLTGLVFSVWLSRRLSVLRDAVLVVGKGDLEISIPDSSRDEIGEVARGFNRMAADLRRLSDLRDEQARETERQNSELKSEVEHRQQVEAELRDRVEQVSEANRRLEVLISNTTEREKRMVDLKQEINDLLLTLGEEPKYTAPQKVRALTSPGQTDSGD